MKEPAEKRIESHAMYSASDLAYLRRKGYTDAEVLALWDRDAARGHGPVMHRPAPDLVSYVNAGMSADDLQARPSRRDRMLEAIVRNVLGVETLATRNAGHLDFRELAVWQLREALRAAY